MEITLNTEKNGIEVRFDSKPDQDILDTLKSFGFRWSKYQKMWYAKQSDDRMDMLEKINNGNESEKMPKVQKEEVYDLFAMTRTDGIESNIKYDNKEIAAEIREHLRKRFPMIKWSVTSTIHHVHVYIKESPFGRDSEELNAIAVYACAFTNSFNYDRSDYMTDYHDVNFYSNVTYSSRDGKMKSMSYILHDEYKEREMTVSEKNIRDLFQKRLAAWNEAEQIRLAKEREEYQKKVEEERKQYEEYLRIEEENRKRIEEEVVINDAEYFVLNCATYLSKLQSEEEYKKYMAENSDDLSYQNCKVTREIHFNKELYDLFSGMLLTDFSFLEHMGGSDTNDKRIKSYEDYSKMSKEEKETVEWYSTNCVAVYCDGELRMVIDPQGYSYARYTYFPTIETEIVKSYNGNDDISEEELERNESDAEMLLDVSAEIINEHSLMDTWNTDNFDLWKSEMKKKIAEKNLNLSIGIVRAIDEDLKNFKSAMYQVLSEYYGVQEQFARAGMVNDQKFTLIRIDPWTAMLQKQHGKFRRVENTTYAQHKDAVRFTFRPENKRSDYYTHLYGDCLVYDGYVDYPKSLLWETVKENDQVKMEKMRFSCCDHQQYKVIIDYFAEQGIKPLVNTVSF